MRLDRDPETRDLPDWYLDQGHVDYGYALTGHKAQGVTTDRTFVIVDGTTDRQWAYVAMSRGRQSQHASTSPTPNRPMNSAPTSPTPVTTMLSMASPPPSTAARPRLAAIDHAGPTLTDDIRSVRPAPTQQRCRRSGRLADRQTPNRTRRNRTADTRPRPGCWPLTTTTEHGIRKFPGLPVLR